MQYQLKLEQRGHDKPSDYMSLDYIGGYDRVSAKINIGGDPEPDITLGVINPSPAMLEIQGWGPMQIMAWRHGPNGPESSRVEIIHVYLYAGDRLWLMGGDGSTIDKLFPC